MMKGLRVSLETSQWRSMIKKSVDILNVITRQISGRTLWQAETYMGVRLICLTQDSYTATLKITHSTRSGRERKGEVYWVKGGGGARERQSHYLNGV